MARDVELEPIEPKRQYIEIATKRPMVVELRPEVLKFAEAMELKLRENAHKSGWKCCDVGYLTMRIAQEMVEFADCLDAEKACLEEAADVANFLMMLCDVRGEL